MNYVYSVVRIAAGLLLPLQLRKRVEGAEHIPAKGPVILVSNHLSLIDPIVIGASLARELHILAKSEVFDWRVLGGLARLCDVVPIRRGRWDVAALEVLEDQLRAGHCVLIFAEGTYPKPPRPPALLPFKIGAAWIAARVHAPIAPVAIWGSESVWARERGWEPWLRPRVHLRFGAPYYPQIPADPSSYFALRPVADEMARHVRDLLPERYHGFYREQPADSSQAPPANPPGVVAPIQRRDKAIRTHPASG